MDTRELVLGLIPIKVVGLGPGSWPRPTSVRGCWERIFTFMEGAIEIFGLDWERSCLLGDYFTNCGVNQSVINDPWFDGIAA